MHDGFFDVIEVHPTEGVTHKCGVRFTGAGGPMDIVKFKRIVLRQLQ